MAMLRIKNRRVFRAVPKKTRVKTSDVRQIAGCSDVIWVRQFIRIDSSGEELLVRWSTNAFHTIAQVPPELVQIAATGKSAGHTDDRDIRRRN